MSLATLAKGTLVRVETAEGSGAYATINEVGDIAGPTATSSEHKVTTHDTAGNVDEFLVGQVDPGSLKFKINIVPANALHKQLRNDKYSLTQRNYRLVQVSGEYETFRGMIKQFDRMHPVDGPRTADVEIRRLGPPTFSD